MSDVKCCVVAAGFAVIALAGGAGYSDARASTTAGVLQWSENAARATLAALRPGAEVAQAPDHETRQRAEELGRAASERLDEIMPQLRKDRLAQVQPKAPAVKPGEESDYLLGPVLDWLDRAQREYQQRVIKPLSDPPASGSVATPAPAPAAPPAKVATPPASPPAPKPPVEAAKPAPAVTPQQPPVAAMPKATPPAPAPVPAPAPAMKTAESGSILDAVQGWIDRANRDYQEVIVKKLSEPAETTVATTPSAPAKKDPGPVVAVPPVKPELDRATEVKKAEDARRVEDERKAAEVRRSEEAKRIAEQKAAEERRLAEARKQDEERRLAEAKRSEEARKTEEGKRAEEARKAEEARRLAEAKRADETRRAEENKRLAEQKAAEERRLADAKRIEDARKADDAKKAEDARRAEEAKRIADQKASEERRIADAKRAEDARRAEATKRAEEARRAEERRVAEAKRVEDGRKADEAKRADEARRAEERRVADSKRAEDARKAEEARKAAEAVRRAAQAPKDPASVAVAEKQARDVQQKAKSEPPRVEEGSATRAVPPKQAQAGKGKLEERDRSSTGAKAAVAAVSRPEAPSRRTKSCKNAGKWVDPPGEYVVKRGDTLWAIAERFYDDGERFPRIYRANKGRIEDPNRIEICQKIWIPARRRR